MKKIFILVALIAIVSTKMSFAQSKSDVALNQLLTSYFDVKNALADDNKDLAIEKVKILSAKVDAVPHKDLPAHLHQIWMDQAAIIKAKATEMVSAKDIKAERKSFEGISYALIKTLKATKFNSKTLYVQYCPMAKASWLNERKDIENPYYGSMMLDCGEVKETVKGN